MAEVSLESLKVFCSYSHNDEPLKDELANHLTMLEQEGVISTWHDRKIPPGKEWDRQINENLNTADIILLLVSSDFISSNYCRDVEVTIAIERHEAGEACVIPIILRNVAWQSAPFAKLQALPKNAQAVMSSSWHNRDDAFTNVAQGIKFAAEQLIKERQQKRAIKEAAIAEYRQKAEELAYDGKISFVGSDILENLQEKLRLTDQEACAIREQALEPYRIYKKNIDKYKQYFISFVNEQGYPLDEKAEAELKKFQQHYVLMDKDLLGLKNEQEVEHQKRQAEKLLEQEKTAANQRQEAELQEERERESSTPVSPPDIQTQSFEFNTATLTAKSAGFLGVVKTYEINHSPGHAEFFTENWGNGVVLEMVAIPGGKFLMGSPESEPGRYDSESPQHPVTIQPFFMGKFPVTQSQWAYVAALPKVKIILNSEPSNFKSANRPVEQVSWDDAIEFCARLSKKTRKTYRLPSEGEWEYACRAGTTTPFYFGETITTDLANNYQSNYGETTDVEKFPANPFGLFDMHGNIWEWCQDEWHKNYNEAPKDGKACLITNDNQSRLLRGGSWYNDTKACRSASRSYNTRHIKSNYVGFRVVVVLHRI